MTYIFTFIFIIIIINVASLLYNYNKRVKFNKSLIDEMGTIYMSFDSNIYLANLDSIPNNKIIVKSLDDMVPGDRFKIVADNDGYPIIKRINNV